MTSFEVSCYTDSPSLERLTGSLGECIRYFGQQENKTLQWVSTKRNKFGGIKYADDKETTKDLRQSLEKMIEQACPTAELLYWT